MKWFAIFLIFLIACVQSGTMDFSEAAKLGKPMKCVTRYEGQTSTMYMKGSQMRIDSEPSGAHGIYTSDAIYTWRGSEGITVKMELMKKIAAEQGHDFTPPTQDQLVARAQQENAQCELADVPESMLAPPADVKFEDLGEMMKRLESTAGNMRKSQ